MKTLHVGVSEHLTIESSGDFTPNQNVFQVKPVQEAPNITVLHSGATVLRVQDACGASPTALPDGPFKWIFDREDPLYLSAQADAGATLSIHVDFDCAYQAWNSWGGCSATCGSGQQTRTRDLQPYHDTGCKQGVATRPCQTTLPACPSYCEVSDWGGWGTCSVSCGIGTQRRTRVPYDTPGCVPLALFGTRGCSPGPCPENCLFIETTGACNETCGEHSYREVTYKITSDAQNNGTACPKNYKTKCSVPKCTDVVGMSDVPRVAAMIGIVVWFVAVAFVHRGQWMTWF